MVEEIALLSHQPYQNSIALSCHVIRVRIAYDDNCWSIIHFANALIQVIAALPSWSILLIHLLILITNKKEQTLLLSED